MNTIDDLFKSDLNIINMGARTFADAIQLQGGRVQHVDWKPPAGGDPEIIALLAKLIDSNYRMRRCKSGVGKKKFTLHNYLTPNQWLQITSLQE